MGVESERMPVITYGDLEHAINKVCCMNWRCRKDHIGVEILKENEQQIPLHLNT